VEASKPNRAWGERETNNIYRNQYSKLNLIYGCLKTLCECMKACENNNTLKTE
jgi:hypothetical protein